MPTPRRRRRQLQRDGAKAQRRTVKPPSSYVAPSRLCAFSQKKGSHGRQGISQGNIVANILKRRHEGTRKKAGPAPRPSSILSLRVFPRRIQNLPAAEDRRLMRQRNERGAFLTPLGSWKRGLLGISGVRPFRGIVASLRRRVSKMSSHGASRKSRSTPLPPGPRTAAQTAATPLQCSCFVQEQRDAVKPI